MGTCIITYQKSNGEIFYRGSKHDYGKKIGDETSMGWKILDIHYKYNNNYYCYHDFYKMLSKQETVRKRLIRKLIFKLEKFY